MFREAAIAEARAVAERDAAIAEARSAAEREAREALAADLQRVQAEAEQMRETAIAEARATAAREARDTLAVEVARVRSEAESTFTEHALNKVKTEAEEAERRRIETERVNAERPQRGGAAGFRAGAGQLPVPRSRSHSPSSLVPHARKPSAFASPMHRRFTNGRRSKRS